MATSDNEYPLGDPTVASVWRRQTFSAAVEAFTPEMSTYILTEHIPAVSNLLLDPPTSNDPDPPTNALPLRTILDAAYDFSRMLHASRAGATADAFYRAFVPELGSILYPTQIELLKRCRRHDEGKTDRVGACVFPVSRSSLIVAF